VADDQRIDEGEPMQKRSLRENIELGISELEDCIQGLSASFDPPGVVQSGWGESYRHRVKNVRLALYLKCIHMISGLNACLVLLKTGHVHEIYSLCRNIDEAGEDVFFLAVPRGKGGGPSDDQTRFVKEFFQEEFQEGKPLLEANTNRDRVSRQRIRVALAQTVGVDKNPSDAIAVHRSLSQTYSGFVHGAYSHLMDLYGGFPGRFRTNGMLGTPRIWECENQLPNYIYRAMAVAAVAAMIAENIAIADRLRLLMKSFRAETGCVPEDKEVPQIMARMKGKDSAP
jgi:hypothetical protein